jgi:hypothetical protein
MAIVFGLNIPLFEVMLIFLILLGIGLILILIELKRLRQMLTEERNIVVQFEKDVARFEDDEGKAAAERLNNYIQGALVKGVPKDQIADVLKRRGWPQSRIDSVLK